MTYETYETYEKYEYTFSNQQLALLAQSLTITEYEGDTDPAYAIIISTSSIGHREMPELDDGEYEDGQWEFRYWDSRNGQEGDRFVWGSATSTAMIVAEFRAENCWAVTVSQEIEENQDRVSQYYCTRFY